MTGAQSADGALSLAWVAYEAHDYAHALLWFRKAQQWSGDAASPKAKEGVALSLRGLERFEELAAFGYAERKVSPVVHDAYYGGMVAWLTSDKPLREVKSEARLEFEDAVTEERSALGGQALAWGALLRGDWALARKWFETAIDWSGFDAMAPQGPPDEARAKLVEGYVQALRASSELGKAEDVAYIWRDASPVIGGLYLQIFTQELAADRPDLSDERIGRFADVADARRSPQGAGALGWRDYRNKQFDEAIAWFNKAIRWSPGQKGDAKINEGYALSLRAAGHLVEAEDFAWEHRTESKELRAAYVAAFSDQLLDPKLSPKLSAPRLARFSEIVKSDKISTGASALGWRRLQDGNCGYSLSWFRKAVAWSEGGVGDDKTYSGYAQGLRAVGMFNEAEDVAYTYAERSAEARELYTNIAIEELTRQWPRVPMTDTRIARFSRIVSTDRSPAGAQALGWRRYMQAGCGYGGRWFEQGAGWSSDHRGDAHLNEGYALTQRAIGRLANAETIAYPWIERAPAMKKLYIDIAVEELSRDNPPEPIPELRIASFETVFNAAHSALGAQSLGWYRFARRENEAAARWFQNALDWWPSRHADADQKLIAIEDYQPILAQLAMRPEDYRRTPRAYPNSSLLIGHDTESYVNTESGLAKTVEGYVRTLVALSRFDDAEALGMRWLERWPPLRGVLIDMAAAILSGPGADQVANDRLARFVHLIEEGRSPVGAEALAWRAYKAKDFTNASRWFRSAIDWRSDDGKISLDIARGYAELAAQSQAIRRRLAVRRRLARPTAKPRYGGRRHRPRQPVHARSGFARCAGAGQADRRGGQRGPFLRRRLVARLDGLWPQGIHRRGGLVQESDPMGAGRGRSRPEGAGGLRAGVAGRAPVRRLHALYERVERARRDAETAVPRSRGAELRCRRRQWRGRRDRNARSRRQGVRGRAIGQRRAGARLATHRPKGLGRRRCLVPGGPHLVERDRGRSEDDGGSRHCAAQSQARQ